MTENPYEFHLPITAGEAPSGATYIERERALRQALDGLKRGHFLVISAPPRSGTTTFLRHLAKHATRAFRGMRSIYVDLANVAHDAEPCAAVVRHLVRDLGEEVPEDVAGIPDLCIALLDRPGPPRVLVLDGFEKVPPDVAKQLVMDLRSGFTEAQARGTSPPIRFVVGSAIDLRALTSVGMTSPLNVAREVPLEDFDTAALDRIAKVGLPGDGWGEFLFDVTGGHPCLAQMACHAAFEAIHAGSPVAEARERARQFTSEQVEAAFGPMFEQLGQKQDQLVLLAGILRGREYPYDRNDKRIRALSEMGILKPDAKSSCLLRNRTFEKTLRRRFEIIQLEQVASRADFLKSTAHRDPTRSATIGVGLQLGDFRIVGPIGHGSMGTVYEAVQESLGRRVALKVLPAYLSIRDKCVERFYQEARAAANLRHPNIVTIYAVGEVAGVHYYAMELIEGHTVEALFTTGSEDWKRIAEIGAQAALALGHGHENGVIHRDVKPSNLLVTQDGLVKVTDYGLARLEVAATSVTSAYLVGTPMYMSPEQAQSPRVKIDARTDVYSLGATLYYMIAGHPPFDGENVYELIQKVIKVEPVPLRRLSPHVPPALEETIAKAMRKDREVRYQTATALAEDLHEFVRTLGAP